MYYQLEPTKCPKCGAIVKVDMSKVMLSNPPCYEWTCSNCGEKGVTKQGDVITFENQVVPATSGYIQKLDDEPYGITGVTTTNATGDGYDKYRKKHNKSYYDFFTESWANKIAGLDKYRRFISKEAKK